ncbi:hypothetical protein GCM10023224_20870 [Streptomonospora halophila]|uniref:Uncharacterized protein n=1 Tax=Streptomonospora halophila TaxID=427369 RepID=A0ABP9GDK4_9ACTN
MARLDSDGVTVLVPTCGELPNGTLWDGVERLQPGDDGYDEALAEAQLRARIEARSPRTEPSEEELDEAITAFKFE